MNKYYLLTFILLLSINQPILAKKADENSVNLLDLASLMLKDNNYERAKIALSQVDLNDENTDLQRFYIVSALLSVRTNNNTQAIKFIQKAKTLGEVDAVMDVYLAQAAYANKDYQLTLNALASAGQSVEKIPAIYLMRAQSFWQLKQYAKAIATLEQASKIFPDDKNFMRRQVFYYLELGYNKQAAVLGKNYLQKFKGQRDDYVAIGNAIRASGDSQSALLFLENAHLQFPNNENISKSLAATYIQNNNFFVAAKIIHDAAILNPSLIKEAAELYRRAGSLYMALTLNGMISDQKEKLKQRMALMLQLENFDQAVAMEDNIKRVHLQNDENMKYALAYAFFKTSSYPKADEYLNQITETKNFKKATELRKIMSQCQQETWRCQ